MSISLFNQNIKEARRDALVSHYLATHDFSSLPEGRSVTTADDLYEYLLLDTKISNAVTTSRLAEAVSSLQLFIHRSLEGYEGELGDDAAQYLAKDAFLDNWDQYNKRYSTWAGKEKLRFYAGNYVEPSLRMRKTELFKILEASLETGKLNNEQVYNSLVKYMQDYQERADLEYISSCTNDDTNDIYYIGRYDSYPARYYWRKAKLDESNEPTEWSEWYPVDLKCSMATENVIFPIIINNILHIYWHTEELAQGEDTNAQKINVYNEMAIDKNGAWRITKKETLSEIKTLGKLINLPAIAKEHAAKTLAVASLPFLPWEEKGLICIDQSYDKENKVMHFLCQDTDKNLYVNSLSLVRHLNYLPITHPNIVYGEKLQGLENILNADVYALSVDNGSVILEYSMGEGDKKESYKYFVILNKYPALLLHGGGQIIGKEAKNIDSFEPTEYLINPKITYSDNKKHVSIISGIISGIIFGTIDFEVTLDIDGKNFTVKCNSATDAILIPGSRVEEGESKTFTINSDNKITFGTGYGTAIGYLSFVLKDIYPDVEAWDVVPTKYGVVNSDQITLVPPENSTCPAFGFGYIEHNYPMFDLTGWLAHTNDSKMFEYLYRYELQSDKHIGGMAAFSGHNGMYLWEIFFHIPYLVATRFATGQRFEEAERWYKYIFNSAGYHDEDGHVLTDGNGQPRYWNCYPLQQDVAWDSLVTMPASTDPDVIANADPMHYKLAIFQHTLDLLISRGDAAYRLLDRDTLTEAKMYYVQALQLLGPRPDLRVTSSWDNPTLSVEAGKIENPATRSGEGTLLTFAQWLRAGDTNEMGDGDFLPPYNDVLLAYWDKLEVRLYNLRHNLSLNGQPLNMPLFATPVDPAELHRQQSGGDGVQGDVSSASNGDTGWRYPLLADHARYAVGQLTQFGSSLLGALERRDGEQLTLLLQTQQIAVLGQQQDIAQKNLESLTVSLESLNTSRDSAEMRKKYFDGLINGDLSATEIAGLTQRSSAIVANLVSTALVITGGALSSIPNTFGLANGGGDFGAPLHAAAQASQTSAMVLDQSATVSEITANYQRRKEDWGLQRDIADKEISQIESQIESLKVQITMQQKQISLAEMESANAQAVYDLQSSRFTGQVLYNWMVSRLSTLYHQLYDATVPVCIQAREALKRELGNNRMDGIFSTPVWNDLYQGLLAGEGLTTELQKLESVWIQNSANGLEAIRTVSLASLRGEKNGSLNDAVSLVLGGKADAAEVGKLHLDAETGIFSAVLGMSALNLAEDYGSTGRGKKLFTKSIAVTLPTLLGPYQDIAATLSDSNGTVATLSHGMEDTGRFVVNFDDSRFLPFEGMDPTSLKLTLSIFNVKGADDAAPNQRFIVENLSDIIFHIRYIMRDSQS